MKRKIVRSGKSFLKKISAACLIINLINSSEMLGQTSTCCDPSSSTTQVDLSNLIVSQALLNPSIIPYITFNSPNPPQLNGYWNSNISNNTVDFVLNGAFTVDQNFEIGNANIWLGPDARIMVNPGVELKIGKCWLHTCNHDYMWQGIDVADNSSIEVSSSIIEEAQVAIRTQLGIVRIDDAIFNANNFSIQIDNWNGVNSNLLCYNTIFQCNDLTTGTPTVLIHPFAGLKPNCGIELNKCINEKIGFELNNPINYPKTNSFRYLNCGIRLVASSATIYNNNFDHIRRYDVSTNNSFGFAISANGIGASGFTPSVTVGFSGNGSLLLKYRNRFSNCDNGISIRNNCDAFIKNNVFENINQTLVNSKNLIGNCVYVNSELKNKIEVTANLMTNFNRGIVMRNLQETVFAIDNNLLNGTNNYSGKESHIGIDIENFVVNGALVAYQSDVFNNTIKHCRLGVYVENYFATNIYNNSVSFEETEFGTQLPPFAGVRYGIRINGGKGGNTVESNYITKIGGGNPSSLLSKTLFGIDVQSSERNNITSNITELLGCGIWFLNTNLENHLTCNIMNQNYVGLRLSSADIGTQGSAANAQDNQWSNTHLDIEGEPTTYATDFYSRSNSYPWFTMNQIPNIYSFPYPAPKIACSLPCPTCPPMRMADIVTEQGDFCLLSEDEKYAAKRTVFEELEKDTSLMYMNLPTDIILLNFYDSMMYSNVALFNQALENLNDSSTNFVASILSNLNPENNEEENERIVLEILNERLAIGTFDYDSLQYETILNIAMQNPIYGGKAVYSARAMLDIVVDDIDNENGNGRHAYKSINMQPYNVGNLFPNPAADIVFYSLRLKSEQQSRITLYDALGNQLRQMQMPRYSTLLPISTKELNSGLYILKIEVDSKPFATEKFVKQ